MKADRFFRLATLAAMKSTSRVRVGAVIADGARAISIGFNDMARTHPLAHPQCLHAELSALISAPHTVGCVIYVVRLLKDGSLGLAKPCERCQGLLTRFGIKEAFYSR